MYLPVFTSNTKTTTHKKVKLYHQSLALTVLCVMWYMWHVGIHEYTWYACFSLQMQWIHLLHEAWQPVPRKFGSWRLRVVTLFHAILRKSLAFGSFLLICNIKVLQTVVFVRVIIVIIKDIAWKVRRVLWLLDFLLKSWQIVCLVVFCWVFWMI